MKSIFLAVALSCTLPAFAAETENTIGKPDCKVINPSPERNEKISWSGACKDGYADGVVTLEWFIDGQVTSHFEGHLQRGRKHGDGYNRNSSMTQYEGNFKDGLRDGYGIEQSAIKTRYEGEWKEGVPDGRGSKTWWDGSSYQGQWKNGNPHGKGKATYTSGTVFEGEFLEGVAAGRPAIAKVDSSKRYDMASDASRAGSHIRSAAVTGSVVPFNKAWDALSKEQQQAVRNTYGMLREEDEPPYPVKGKAGLYDDIVEASDILRSLGYLRLTLMIDSTGTPSTVTVFSSPDPQLTKLATSVLMRQKFKPALCAGTPCEMAYEFSLQMTAE